MSSPTPDSPKSFALLQVQRDVTDHLEQPFFQRKTTWAALSGLMASAVALLTAVYSFSHPLTPTQLTTVASVTTGLVGICNSLGNLFAREGGVQAAAAVDRKVDVHHEPETGTS